MDQLLITKLYIPQHSINLVSRPRIYEQLDEGLNRKLTLISAPTGFGKSTAVTGWLAEKDFHLAWLSLDQGDNDPVRFWTYLIAAVQTIDQEIGAEAQQIVKVPQLRSNEPVAISLINDISQFDDDLILVVDDYHIIEADQIHSALSFLLEFQPPNLHIVLITRVDPPISFARLRAHNQLIEIRAENLQFSTEEAATLFNEKMGLNLKSENIEALNTHTEKWVVGLQLAGLSLQGKTSYDTFIEEFTGGHKYILDYLTEEVLDTLSDDQRGFLLRTSILERFCSELCCAVTGDPSSQELLDTLRKKNLFLIPLDNDERWFRYHHLFAEVLNVLLERDHPDEIETLHLKAGTWFENEGYPDEAVEHVLRSGNMLQARDFVLKYLRPVLHRGGVSTVLRWLDALPDEIEQDDPILSLARCWVLFISGQSLAIEPYVDRANNACKRMASEGKLSHVEQDEILGQVAMMRSVLARARGEHAKSVAYVEEVVRLATPEMTDSISTGWNMLAAARAGSGDFEGAIEAYERGIELTYAEGNLVGAFLCIYGKAMYMLVQGQLKEAEQLCRSTINLAVSEGHGELPAAGSLYITMARINLERYHLNEAEVNMNTGLRIARPGGFSEAVRTGRYLRTHLAAAQGDFETAVDIFQQAERIVSAIDDPYLTGELNWEWAKFCLKIGDLDAAREKLHILEQQIAVSQHANMLIGKMWLFPRLLCAEGRFEEALTELDKSIHHTRASHSNGELIRLLALQAVVLDALGDHKYAFSSLHDALALGAEGGYIWRWLDAGPRIGLLLQDIRGDLDFPLAFHDYLDSLLDACQSAFGESTQPQIEKLPDLLTPREAEIIRLIGRGYSNPEIADELVVSLNTIKKHTSNIYGKLGVSSRTQAIARAHDLNLL